MDESDGMIRFEMHRDTDPTGASGTGVVADGIRLTDDPFASIRRAIAPDPSFLIAPDPSFLCHQKHRWLFQRIGAGDPGAVAEARLALFGEVAA
jgi:hypothetical protein